MKKSKVLIPYGNTFRLVLEDEISSLPSNHQITLAVMIANAWKKQGFSDALNGKDRYYHGRKVVDALQAALVRLDDAIPGISTYVHDVISNSRNN